MDTVLSAKELKQALLYIPDDAKIILSTVDLDNNILSHDFARNICISDDKEIMLLSNKTMYSINADNNQ
jgi:hypothetical protein